MGTPPPPPPHPYPPPTAVKYVCRWASMRRAAHDESAGGDVRISRCASSPHRTRSRAHTWASIRRELLERLPQGWCIFPSNVADLVEELLAVESYLSLLKLLYQNLELIALVIWDLRRGAREL